MYDIRTGTALSESEQARVPVMSILHVKAAHGTLAELCRAELRLLSVRLQNTEDASETGESS